MRAPQAVDNYSARTGAGKNPLRRNIIDKKVNFTGSTHENIRRLGPIVRRRVLTNEQTKELEFKLGVRIQDLHDFCKKKLITKLELFGSILRPDFDDNSDVDIMVTCAPDYKLNLFQFASIQTDFSQLLNRPVDLVIRAAIEQSTNPYRRNEILMTAEILYAA